MVPSKQQVHCSQHCQNKVSFQRKGSSFVLIFLLNLLKDKSGVYKIVVNLGSLPAAT